MSEICPERVQAAAPLTGHVPVRFAPEVVRAVQALAASEGMTVSAWIRREVEREVSRRASPASPASAAASTPGQAAYEAFLPGGPIDWEYAASDVHAMWEAAAQAAIAAAPYELDSADIGEGTVWEDVKAAPELTAAMAETRQLRDLTAEILAAFGPSGSGHTARVGQVQIRKWRQRAGLEGQ